MWHVGAGAAVVVALIMLSSARSRAAAQADSTRAAQEAQRTADSTARAIAAVRQDSINRKHIADSVARAIDLATKAKQAAALAAARRAAPATRESFSRCPATGSRELAQMTNEPALLADSIGTYVQGDTLRLNYDVCGLKAGTAFHTEVTLRKLRQNRIGRVLGGGQ